MWYRKYFGGEQNLAVMGFGAIVVGIITAVFFFILSYFAPIGWKVLIPVLIIVFGIIGIVVHQFQLKKADDALRQHYALQGKTYEPETMEEYMKRKKDPEGLQD